MKNKYLLIFFILFITVVFFSGCSSSGASTEAIKHWKYFLINASTDDDPVFVKLQEELGIEPKLQSYILIVDIRDSNPQNQFIELGNFKTTWTQLSAVTRKKILEWNSFNKENLEKQ